MALRDQVKQGEEIVREVKISKAAILVDWLSIPCVFLFFFLTVCLPVIVQTYAKEEVRNKLLEMLGAEEIGFFDIMGNLGFVIGLPAFVRGFVVFLFVLLGVSWLVFCLIQTKRHFGYEIVITERRILARAKSELFDEEWSRVKNVFVERSLWGKLFRYGTVTIHGVSGSVSVRHVGDPESVQKEFYLRMKDIPV